MQTKIRRKDPVTKKDGSARWKIVCRATKEKITDVKAYWMQLRLYLNTDLTGKDFSAALKDVDADNYDQGSSEDVGNGDATAPVVRESTLETVSKATNVLEGNARASSIMVNSTTQGTVYNITKICIYKILQKHSSHDYVSQLIQFAFIPNSTSKTSPSLKKSTIRKFGLRSYNDLHRVACSPNSPTWNPAPFVTFEYEAFGYRMPKN